MERRNTPKQPRAQRTVERIISAAEKEIVENGMEVLSTNRIAQRANINIATLYQYFPHKESILDALVQKYMHNLTRYLNDLLDGLDQCGIEDSSRLWTQAGIHFFRSNDQIFLEIFQHASTSPNNHSVKQLENRLMESMRRFLTRNREQLNVSNLDNSIYVAFYAATAVIAKHLAEPIPYLTDEEIIEEVAKLISAYLKS